MRSVQMLKFLQNLQLQTRLLQTGDAHLIYKSETDSFFGSGHDGRGSNHLGKILMEIRSFFKTYLDTASDWMSISFGLDPPSPPTRSIVWGPNLASDLWYPRNRGALKEIAIEPAIADAPAYESAFLHSIVHGDMPWKLDVLIQLREEVKENDGPQVRILHTHHSDYSHYNKKVDVRLSSGHLKSSLMNDGGIYIYSFPVQLDRLSVEQRGCTVSIALLTSETFERSDPDPKLIFTLWEE
ncbi:hypothetical protein CF326_g3049 [Tilletia indica]|nr:hypothetical protein CF326_g3049 [Tilletia indica]